jgi:superfamily II DNA/RNA helicase
LFAATVGETMTKMAQRFIKNPERIQIAPGKVTHDYIEQRLLMADDLQHKTRLLHHFCDDKALTKAIIFSATKCDADSLAHDLNAKGYSAAALHGDMTQYARNRTMMNMRLGKIRLLVATDVAARGLDVRGISHIINFDLPRFAEDYVHRIGRTGRAGESGIAISFASPRDLLYINRIERYLKQNLTRHIIPGLEPAYQLTRPVTQPKNNRRGPSPKRENGTDPTTPRRVQRNIKMDERVQRFKDSRIQGKGLGIKTHELSTRNHLESQASYGIGKPISINKSGLAGKPPSALPGCFDPEILKPSFRAKNDRKKSRPGGYKGAVSIKGRFAGVRQGATKQDGGVAVEYRRGKSGHPGRPVNKKNKKINYFGAKD